MRCNNIDYRLYIKKQTTTKLISIHILLSVRGVGETRWSMIGVLVIYIIFEIFFPRPRAAHCICFRRPSLAANDGVWHIVNTETDWERNLPPGFSISLRIWFINKGFPGYNWVLDGVIIFLSNKPIIQCLQFAVYFYEFPKEEPALLKTSAF